MFSCFLILNYKLARILYYEPESDFAPKKAVFKKGARSKKKGARSKEQ